MDTKVPNPLGLKKSYKRPFVEDDPDDVTPGTYQPSTTDTKAPNPLGPKKSYKRPFAEDKNGVQANPPEKSSVTRTEKVVIDSSAENVRPILPEDSAATKAEKVVGDGGADNVDERDKVKGIALVKPEYLIDVLNRGASANATEGDDAAKGRLHANNQENGGQPTKKKRKGQNKDRPHGFGFDAIKLCKSRANSPELSPNFCQFGDRCKLSHNLREYLRISKRPDLDTFDGKCPVWEVNGKCDAGWKCRFAGSHSKEIQHEDGRMELVLFEDSSKVKGSTEGGDEGRIGVYNVVGTQDKADLARRRRKAEKAEAYTKWLDEYGKALEKVSHQKKDASEETKQENRAQFVDPPFLPSEKRRIYFGPETPVLAPLTTQGNTPFRRMCVEFGAQLTYSEMAMSRPLIQGENSEWALMKAHESEISPPRCNPTSVVQSYDNSKDLKFGAQVSANKPWQAFKAAEYLAQLVPHLRVIDLNCGCPIDLVFQSGAGSALLDAPSKLEKMIRGMNTLSGEIPITAKIRMGVMTAKPTATKTIERLAFGGHEFRDKLGAPGCAAITLHGRSRQQRYTKSADWSYIAECAALIKSYNAKKDDLADTINEPDARTQANSKDGKLYFIGNGDCYSHVDYLSHVQNAGVDSVMLGRGALIKPWIFEEIEKGQYLDKSATERLTYVENFVRYGLEVWGSDEAGVGLTRRFLLEWLSFAHRYVPIGILAHLPPSLQDRPPAYRGRNELETLLASDNYLDWIKIAEMFLGPAHKDFKFQPKHKSNSYEIEAEG